MYFALLYEYVPDVLERRPPLRADHLALASEYSERGDLVIAGAFADPVDGALLVFNVSDRAAVERFVEADPYVRNGLVPSWQIREWTVVAGRDAPGNAP